MKYIILLILLVSQICLADTISFVPRADGEGSLGTASKNWGTAHVNQVYINNQELRDIITNDLSSINLINDGDLTLLGDNGISITTDSNNRIITISLTNTPIDEIGTNRVYFVYTGYTNYFTIPNDVTKISVLAWGGGGSCGSGPDRGGSAGFSYGTFNVSPNDQMFIEVGGGGGRSVAINGIAQSSSAFPNGGRAVSGSDTEAAVAAGAGGGRSSVGFVGVESNTYLIVAGGGGGSGNDSSGAGNGGGLTGEAGSSPGGGGGSQTAGGYTQNNSSYPSLSVTNTPGRFLGGGDSGVIDVGWTTFTFSGGGGGDGWYGGGGGLITSSSGKSYGGGGSGYINTNFGFGFTVRGIGSNASATPVGTDRPEYISGVGVPGVTIGGHGLVVIGYQ